MKLWIEKRNEFNIHSRKFTEEYFVLMNDSEGQKKLLFISDSIDDASFMFERIAKEIKPSSIKIIKEIEL